MTSARQRIRRNSLVRALYLSKRPRKNRTDWRPVIAAGGPVEPVTEQRRQDVLVATSIGSFQVATSLESALAAALQLRGATVHVLLCDAALPACMACTFDRTDGIEEMAQHGPRRDLCPGCFATGVDVFEPLGVRIHRYADYLTPTDLVAARELAATTPVEDLRALVDRGVAVGEQAYAGALRFFGRATIDGESGADAVLRRYVEAAILTARCVHRLFDSVSFDAAVFHHGIYVPQGVIGEVARMRNVRVVNWTTAYRQQCFIFSHTDTYHHTLMTEPMDAWTDLDLDGALEESLLSYLRSRWSGTRDWISFSTEPHADGDAIFAELGIDPSRPCIGMLTNVMWDAQLHYPANAFADMREWAIDTVRYFATRPDLQLLIRVHPAELTGYVPSRQPIVGELASEFPQLPPNVFIIGPESKASTYAAMLKCDSVVIYGTKTGVELAAVGMPVIVAGEAWVRGKGFTLDASSREEYRSHLDRLPLGERLDDETRRRAMQYAFHFFFRRMIPLEFVNRDSSTQVFTFDIATLEELEAGRSIGLDVICRGILEGTPFDYPAERLLSAAAPER